MAAACPRGGGRKPVRYVSRPPAPAPRLRAMSDLSGTAYRARAHPQAISATKLLGQVMFLVAIALAFAAVGTLVGRDLPIGTARLLSFGGFGMLMVSSFAGARFRVGSFAMGW